MKDHGKKGGWHYTPPSKEGRKKRTEQRSGKFEPQVKDGVTIFSPKEGGYKLRFLPATWEDPEHFGFDVFVHYGVGADDQTFICPTAMGIEDGCTVCADEKSNTSDERSRTALKKRVAYYVIDRKDEDAGPKVWLAPWTWDKEMSAQGDSEDGEALPVDNPKRGYDVLFTRTGTGLATKYIGTKFSRHATPLSDNPEKAKEWLRQIVKNPIPKVLNIKSVEFIDKVFSDAVAGKDEEAPATLHKKGKKDKTGKKKSKPEADDLNLDDIPF